MAATKNFRFSMQLFLILLAVAIFSVSGRRSPSGEDLRNKAMLKYIHRRMLMLSRREGSKHRLVIECSRPMRRKCHKHLGACRSSILNKRSVDSQLSEFSYESADTFLKTESYQHKIVKRAVRRRKKIKLTCELCQEKCWTNN